MPVSVAQSCARRMPRCFEVSARIENSRQEAKERAGCLGALAQAPKINRTGSTGVCTTCLRGKVHHGVDALGAQDVAQQVAALQVALDELEARRRGRGCQVLQRAAVVQLIQHHNLAHSQHSAPLYKHAATAGLARLSSVLGRSSCDTSAWDKYQRCHICERKAAATSATTPLAVRQQ